MNIKKNNKGFTLVEILVTVSILALMVTIGFPIFHSFKDNIGLNNQANEMINDLRKSQRRSIVSQDFIRHGIHFDSNSYTLFGDSWGSPQYSETHMLQYETQIVSGAGGEVVFDRLTGEANAKQIKLALPNGKEKIITVTDQGAIY